MDFAIKALVFLKKLKLFLGMISMPYSSVGMMEAFIYVKADSESNPHLTPDNFLRTLILLVVFL